MTPNETIIHKFYTAFANANAEQMCKYYHPNVQFRDPAFGFLKGEEVLQMWRMLIERSKGNLKIDFSEIMANEYLGTAQWIATYRFSATNREVINTIESKFHFKEGLIIKHTDDFNMWKWTTQALGIKGLLLGWTGFMQKKIQDQARMSLHNYCEKKRLNTEFKNKVAQLQ
ncbi:nuclear transport factor 2 family protein [Flavobacterium sp.]|uniref:nuclear transport factor 2 family protein n=1 Tax=Flavobacterium sp. TaxID=239 RepID=UPI00286EAF86|nr:nuclear transport factor 2 family protein [Flavobacterium sp.]